jgi:hypothetical protein
VGYDDGEVFDRASFSRLLRKASLREAKEYSMMSYLCNIAYMIPRIQVPLPSSWLVQCCYSFSLTRQLQFVLAEFGLNCFR